MALKSNTALDGTLITDLKPASEKRVELVCDSCGKEGVTNYHNYTLSQRKRAFDGKTYCKRCATKRAGFARRGKPVKKRSTPAPCGAKHAAWKGGRYIASDGYVQIYQGLRKHRKEHFLVIEQAIGRTLLPTEIVHHVDGDKQNNKLENLVLLTNEKEHRAAHNSLYSLSCLLVRQGVIVFDRRTNSYKAVDKLRELLEQPEEANQQPSQEGNLLEGSTTRCESQADDNTPTSAGRSIYSDDIV